jgi:hypothetical protein
MQALLGTPIDLPSSTKETQSALRKAQKTCREAIHDAREIAKQHQEDRLIARQIANPSTDPEKIAKKIRSRDATRDMWRRIPSSKPHSSIGISMIKVTRHPEDDPKNPGTAFRTVVDPSEMESLLISRNQKHFSQAKHTPLASPHISESVGWGAQLSTADSILDGSHNLPALTPNPHLSSNNANASTQNSQQRYYLK